jgi:hypothetical protein
VLDRRPRRQHPGEQEQILAELIQNTPDAEVEEKSDYYFRLGELYKQPLLAPEVRRVGHRGRQREGRAGESRRQESARGEQGHDYLLKR